MAATEFKAFREETIPTHSESVPMVELTDGKRTIAVGVSSCSQVSKQFVRATRSEHVGEFVTFETEAQARQALGADLAAPETFEWVRKFLDHEIPYEQFMAGRPAATVSH